MVGPYFYEIDTQFLNIDLYAELQWKNAFGEKDCEMGSA